VFEHQIKNLADVATSEVLVLDTQSTRVEMAEHVLAVAPQRFSIAGHSLGGWGRQDRVVVEEEVEFLADGIAGAALALIEEAGHCSPIEQPQAFPR
jgi:pimeloyl-ACP methyl ester carboxylesterase